MYEVRCELTISQVERPRMAAVAAAAAFMRGGAHPSRSRYGLLPER